MALEPLVTVVVPTFNRAHLVGETIESILAQEFSSFELLVISDGSTDTTEAVVSSYRDPRVKLLVQSNSGGPARPRNTGVQYARGKYVAFCDDDDLWLPKKLEKQVWAMEQRPDAALCFTGGVTFGRVSAPAKRLKRGFDGNHFRRLLYSNFIANSTVLVRKDVLADVGPFNEERILHGTEDYEMWLRVAFRYALLRIDEPLIKYRVHRGSLGGIRARGILRGMYAVTSLKRKGVIQGRVFLPLLWQGLKYTVYAVARL